ncbi:transcriptional regulator, LysR family [Arboricoccus pini]|uniref:Transcriptional regulator, LysR family n=1 Tax=Arboricoccus pini TaxID=1963835 RepID=A0A212R467_9PROT|nr:LysR family transcriptional regulator [Arboricoccus pini]SNB66862.1 transcriptional regulator, LysR family [Arboricoccus pini]
MESLTGLLAFVRTAETLSFVAAGRLLGISASAVGKNVAKLEQGLGVRLFQRSTRRIGLTAEGALFYERCRRILDDLQEAETMVSHAARKPRGKLRVSLPTIGYRFLLHVLSEFSNLHPEVELDFDFNDRIVDVIEDGFDAVIRSGDLPDSRLMSHRLSPFCFVLCAAPAYLEIAGIPETPDDLKGHKCIRFRFPTSGKLQEWSMKGVHEPTAGMQTVLTCNNMEALRGATLDGFGIAYMPDFLVRDLTESGELVTVLDEYLANPGQFWILWPSSRYLSPKVRVFVDFMAKKLFIASPNTQAG